MHTIASPSPAIEISHGVFSAIRELVQERLRKHQNPEPSEDDDALVRDIIAFVHGIGAHDTSEALTTLIRVTRERELRDVADQIAILGFEKFGQELRLLDEVHDEVLP